jgi:hypothetical protein
LHGVFQNKLISGAVGIPYCRLRVLPEGWLDHIVKELNKNILSYLNLIRMKGCLGKHRAEVLLEVEENQYCINKDTRWAKLSRR